MRRLCSFIILASIATSVFGDEAVTRLGEPLTEGLEPTPIEEILADPEVWEGKRVRVAGEIAGVCAMQGCWMDLVSPDDATLRVKVDDGVIVFPSESIGEPASAEGTVEILEMDRERYLGWLRHVAEEEGSEFDPATVGEGPHRVVRLRGLGAEIGSSAR